ncbi:hypothetical protein H2248_007356 [Termitomyces sp. 'cryptogamus']|nr:hypothetical protein H2248_007356 [Termitomyces sp. 'cryptogamus']
MPPPARPTTPSNSQALIKKNTRCLLRKAVEVKVVDVSTYPEHANKIYILAQNCEVVTRSDPVPAVMTGATEPLSVDNASYAFIGTMNLTVYEEINEEISHRTNLLRHSNICPLDPNTNMSNPLPRGTLVSVKKRVVNSARQEVVSTSELLKITTPQPYSPRTEMKITGPSSLLPTASYSAVKVLKANRKVQVYNPIRIFHKDLMKLDLSD